MFTEAAVREQVEVLICGGSSERIAYANTFLMAFQNSVECWAIARALLSVPDPNVQILASQLIYNKTKAEWTHLAPGHQAELRDYLNDQLRARGICSQALKKMAQAFAFICVLQASDAWPSVFSDVLGLFQRDLTLEVLSSITSALRDSSDTSTNDQISARFLAEQDHILSFLERGMQETQIGPIADLLMELSSCGFVLLRHSIASLLVQAMMALAGPAIDVLIVAIGKTAGGAEIHRRIQEGSRLSASELLNCYQEMEMNSLRQIAGALVCLEETFPGLEGEVRKKVCDLVCSFCSDHLFLLVQVSFTQNEPYAPSLWRLLYQATCDPDTEIVSLAVNFWSDIKSEVLKGFASRAEFGVILEAAEKCAHMITMKCCFSSIDDCSADSFTSTSVKKLRQSAEDSLYSLLCIFSEADKAQPFLETFLPLLEAQNPLHLELFLFVMRSMGLELESDKNRPYIGNVLSLFMKTQHPFVTRAILQFISEVSSTIKKIPGLLERTVEFANEQIMTEARNGTHHVTPAAVECLFNLMFYSEHQLQDQALQLMQTSMMILQSDYIGEVDRVLDLVWLLLNTIPREVALQLAPEVVSSALSSAQQIEHLSQTRLHQLLKRCFHLVRILTTEAWIKPVVQSAWRVFSNVCIGAVRVANSGTLSLIGDLAYILFKRFGEEEPDLHLVLFPALMGTLAYQSRSCMSAIRAGMESAAQCEKTASFVRGQCGPWYESALSFAVSVVSEPSWQEWLTHFYGVVQIMISMEAVYVLTYLEGLLALVSRTFLQTLDLNLSRGVTTVCKILADGPNCSYLIPHLPMLVSTALRGVGRVDMASLVSLLYLLLKYRAVDFARFQDGLMLGLMSEEFGFLSAEEKDTVMQTFTQVEESQIFILKEMLFGMRVGGPALGKSLKGIAKKIGCSTPKSRKELVLIEC